jgi:phage-related protein
MLVTGLGTVLIPIITMVWGVIKTVIEALVGIFRNMLAAVTPIWDAILSVFTSVADALQPLFGAAASGTGIFETLVQVLTNVVLVPFRLFGFVLGLLVPIITFFASNIATTASMIGSVLKPAFQWFADMMAEVSIGFRKVINGLIDSINFVLDYIPGTSFISRIGEANVTPTAVPNAPAATTAPGNNFQGQARQTSSLGGIAEAWRKAQTASTTDPNTALLQQQVNQTGAVNGTLQQILITMQGSTPTPGTFAN